MAGSNLKFAAATSAALLISSVTFTAVGSAAEAPPLSPVLSVADFVLLSNDGTLPVASGELAVITASTPALPTLAQTADEVTPEEPTTLAGLLGASTVTELGSAVPAGLPGGPAIPPELLGVDGAGLQVEYFSSADLTLSPELTQPQLSSVVRLPADAAATRVTGTVTIPLDGSYEFTLAATGAARMLVDGIEVTTVDASEESSAESGASPDVSTTSVRLDLTGGTELPVQVDMVDETSPEPVLSIGWRPPVEVGSAAVEAAVQAAAEADTVLIHVPSLTSRATDTTEPARLAGALPVDFAQLLTRVAESNPRIVVVTDAAAADDLEKWAAPAVLHVPTGAVDLETLARVVRGELQPSGTLQAALPLTHGPPLDSDAAVETDAEPPEPLYAAGHGLTYWKYEIRSIAADSAAHQVALEVAASGTAPGSTSLYVAASTAGSQQLEPVGTGVVELAAGESAIVTIPLDLSALDLESPDAWPVTLYAGTSLNELTATAELGASSLPEITRENRAGKAEKQQKQGGIVRPAVPGLALTTGAGAVMLENAVEVDGRLRLTGTLPTVSVSDARQGAGTGWTVSARASDLTGPGGALPASNLGWAPLVLTTADGVSAGPPVAGSLSGGQGLSEPAVLGHASRPVGTVQFGADFVLEAPATTVPGTYSGTLTVTLFPIE